MIVSVDAGNSEVKTVSAHGVDRFPSAIGEYRERNIKEKHGKDDIIYEYEGRKGFAGTLALYESEYGGAIMGESKAHLDAKLRVLIALHRLGASNVYNLVVNQPISKHDDTEKAAIRAMLIGEHKITVNNIERTFRINDVVIAAEGGAAFLAEPRAGIVRVIDVGGGTVNCATFNNKRFIDRDSFTLPFGLNTVKNADPNELVRGVVTQTSKKWNPNDLIYVVGGAATVLTTIFQAYYPNARKITPMFKGERLDAIFANAVGSYAIGSAVYAKTN
jgi:plasmid segregation protein ParM